MSILSSYFGKGMLILGGMPMWAFPVILVLTAGFVAGAFALQRGAVRRPIKATAFLLRFVALTLVVTALATPKLRSEEPVPHQSFIAHVYDTSGSMGISDYDGQARLAAVNASAISSPARAELERLYRSIEYSFDEKLAMRSEPGVPSASTNGTDLAGAFRTLTAQLKGLPVTGVMLYSDGNATLGSDKQAILDAASGLGAPVYCVGSAPQRLAADVWIEKAIYPDEVVRGVNSKVSVLVGSREVPGASIEVALVEDGKEIARRKISGSRDERTSNVEFAINPAEAGPHGYEAQVTTSGKEAYPWNNKRTFFINAVQKKRRILYVEGYPRYEYRFLRAAFEDDDRFQVTSMVFLDQTGKTYRQGIDDPSQLGKGFPASQDELFQYDVVVLGDISARRFSREQLTTLREFVRTKGGGLLFLAGQDSFDPSGFSATPLADVLPFSFSDTPKLAEKRRVTPTREGIERSMFGPYDPSKSGEPPWSVLPAIQGLYPLNDLKPGAIALCMIDENGSEGAPVVAYQRYGRGTSLICGVSATWQWKFQVPSENPSYSAFWKEMTLILLEQSTERLSVKPTPPMAAVGRDVILEVSVLDDKYRPDAAARATLEIRPPTGSPITVEPQPASEGAGLRHTLTPTVPGIYHILATARTGAGPELRQESMFLVEPEVSELSEVRLNESLLKEIAAVTGGQYVHLSEFNNMPQFIKPKAGSVIKVREKPIWDRASLLTALLVALGSEWLIRRLGNLA